MNFVQCNKRGRSKTFKYEREAHWYILLKRMQQLIEENVPFMADYVVWALIIVEGHIFFAFYI